jgi:predicted MFS family arabinose efflux permease
MGTMYKNPMDRKAVILSAVGLSALGALFYNLLPLFVGVAQDYRNLDNKSVGLLSSMFFAGFILMTSGAFFWIRRANWRTVTWLALATGGLSMLLAGYTRSHGLLVLCVFFAGGAFSAVYGIAATILGDTSNPARWYGLKVSAEAVFGAIFLFVLPGTLIASHGFMGMMAGMVLAVVLIAPVLVWLPASGNKQVKTEHPKSLPLQSLPAVWIGLFAVTLFMFSATMVWAFVERLASTAGFERVLVGKVLSMTLVFAVLGSLLAVVLGSRYGSGKPFAAATIVFLLAVLALSRTTTVSEYAISACLLMFAIGLGIAYVITIVAELDMDGRYVVLTVSASGVGAAGAPLIGGHLATLPGFSGIFLVASATIVLSLLAGLAALKMGLPRSLNAG